MTAIYQREMRSYLTSAVGYVFLAVFYAIAGYYFFATSLVSNSTDLSYVFSNLFSIVIFLVPMLTMRLFSEERRQKTEQALFTAPVSFTGVVMGKFLACLTMYLLGMGVTLLYFLVMCAFQIPDVAVFCGNREPGHRGGGFAGDRAVFAVCQQLHAGGFERMDQRGDGRNFLLPALSGLHQGAAQSFRPDLLCQRDGAVFIFDGAASGTPQNLVGRGKKR